MTSSRFLEIVVPTYNRASILHSTLRELSASVHSQSEFISLRVIDNCSTDTTSSVIGHFVDRGLLTAQQNEENIGLIRNIAKCIATSSAEWVWVFGDDDHILLHCLPRLIKTLQALPHEVVFARGLTAKLNADGRLVGVSRPDAATRAAEPVSIYDNGLDITAKGNIHALAFISTLFIRPRFWNQNYHDSIYQATDLYTFVLALLHESAHRKTADLNFHVVAATDRGDRSYYTVNMCVARLTEYTNFERLVHAEVCRRRAWWLLRKGRKGLLKLRIASCFKLIAYRDDYRVRGKDPIAFLRSYSSPYWTDQWVVRLLGGLAMIPGVKSIFKYVYDGLRESHERRN
ncbi:glycosyltransferase [Cyanobium sp. Aljojuca 7D2]|nr:glycosyltransferase [Cyanobium sp. Aljojuca 7D2]